MVTTEKRNEENRLSKFKKPWQTWQTLAGFFRQNPECFKKQTGKHRTNDGHIPLRNAVSIGVFPKNTDF